MDPFEADVDQTIFDEGEEAAYMLLDHDDALIINETYCNCSDFVIVELSNSLNVVVLIRMQKIYPAKNLFYLP